MTDTIQTLLLLALPASGKSELRRYLGNLSPEECHARYGIGRPVQLDDFPYVHFMHLVDEGLTAMGREPLFFAAPDQPFADPVEWGTLTHLLNEDFYDLTSGRPMAPLSGARYLFWRLDRARAAAGGKELLAKLPPAVFDELADRLDGEATRMIDNKATSIPSSMTGRTAVIEFARGGPDGADMPLSGRYGYQYSLAQLSEEILESAAILYVWVTPEESRRKNGERADPDDPGSILNHGVPIDVMMKEYGTDDIEYLIQQSDRPGTIRVEAHGRTFHLPIGRFDNRTDRTTFLRGSPKEWPKDELEALEASLDEAFRTIRTEYRKIHAN